MESNNETKKKKSGSYKTRSVQSQKPPASTLDESTGASSQDDGFSPSRGVRCQYSSFDEETKKNSPRSGCVGALSWSPNASAPARPHEMIDDYKE